ncbi:Bifunctional hemolysin/adenylate cyclase [Dolichospermum sp. UHCC 0315A]|nr:Bifunctional hemolysin/adenylate cyclase [Dolichospermum sp. UHCC 0315A]
MSLMNNDSAVKLISSQLGAFASQDNFWSLFDVAFGKDYNQAVARRLKSQWQAGDFSQFPKVAVVSSSILVNANGAYAASTNTIYLADAFVDSASPNNLISVLLEEYGHFVDAQINQIDSAGDEGAIFASLVMGENLSQLQLSQLMSEDDSATILLNGQTIQIEKSGTPGFTIIPLTSLVTTEAGGTAKVSVQLNTQPTDSVTIPLRSDNVKEGVLDKSSLTFTPTNWNVAQVLTITGVDDQTSDGDIAYNIISDPVISNDLIYRELGKNSGVYSFINQDNEVNGNLIIFNPITPLVTTESGGTAKFSVSLGRQPSSNVTIPVIISNIKEGILDKSSLTFTSTNWNVPQVLTVTGVDDLIDDSDVSYNLDVSPAVSNDPSYQGLVPAYYGAKITNNDDDQTGISVTPLTPLVVTEDGGTAQFTLRLNSQPVSPVKVELSLNRSLGILDNYTLIFTSENWNQPQPVTVTGVLDDVVEGGDYPSTISISAVNQDYELARAEGRYVSNSPNGDGYGIGAVSTVVNVLKKSIVYQYVPFTGGYVSQLRQDNNFANTLSVPGTSGNDRFYSYTGYIDNQFIQINKLFGQGGSDWLSGSFSSENPDELYGQEGNDYLIGGSGDKLFGGTGNDFYKVFYSNVIVSDDSGIDTVIFYVENYTLPPTIENLELSYHVFNGIGNDLNNYIIGNDQGNSLFGRGGNDTIDGKSGNDTIDGGDGDDTIDGKSGNDTIDGGDGDDTIVGGYDDDILKGGVGNDVLYGRRSLENSARENDILEGGEGDDILYGQGGNDKLYGGDGNDKLYGGEGDDILEGGSGNDILYDLFGKNSLKGGLGDDEYTLGVTNISFGTTPEGNTIDDEGGTNDTLKFLTLENLEGLFTWDLTSYTPRNSSFSQSANRNLFGVKADDTTLWVDTNQDNVIDANNDLEIKNYYKKIVDAEGKVSYSIGVGYIENMKFVVEEDKEPPDTKPLLIKAINGKFNDNDGDGTWNANGTILIGRQDGIEQMLTVDDANAEISQQSIKFTNGTVYSSIFQIPTPLFTGNFTIPIGTSATSAFQEISSLPNEFSPAGLDLSLSKFNLAKNQIELQGKVTLPINFDSVVIDITGGNNFVIAEDGFGLTGANIQLPNTNFAYENIVKIQATNLSLGWEKDFFKIQGSVEGSSPFLRNAKFNADFSGNNYIKISDNGSNESRVDVIGSLAVENLSLGKWGINQASVFINTVDGNITGTADVKLPWGLISGLKGTLGFQKSQATWELDSAAIDISGDFPLPILPVVSLTKLGGKVSNLSENATSPIIFEGNATLDVKPSAKLTTVLPDWVGKQFTVNSVATFTGGSKIDENSLKMNGTADILAGLLAQVKVTDLDIDWNKLSLTSKVDASILNGLVSLNGGLSADSNFNFTAFGEGQVTLPSTTFFKLFGLDGKEILSAGIGVKYINNDIFSDDSVAGWGSAGFLDKKVGFRVFLDGKTDIIGAKEIESYKPTTVPAEGSIPLDITANNNQGNLPDDSTLYQILESALPNAYSYLQQFATSSEFVTTMNLAFDSNWNKTVGYQIAQTWAVGNFDNIPIIKMISAANIGGANAAFADSTNTIYIAKEYLAYHSSNLDSLTDVLLEEIGHWVDAQVNSIDTLGDEGAILSNLLRHQTLSNQQFAQLKAEDDTLTITLDGINTQLNLNSSQQDSFSIASNTPWFLLAINWENGTSNVPFEIQAPDGKIYTEADLIGSQTISIVNELSSSTRKVLRIDNPDAGIWKIKLPDTTNLGKVGFSSLGGLEAPTITIGSLQQEINSSNVVINYDINNIDANAQISFYYDVDNNGFNGNLIGVVNPQSEGLGKYTWNTQGVNLGNYYIYALVSDNNRIPTSAYSLNGITLTSTPFNHPPTLQNKILKQTAPENSVFSFTIPTNTFNDIDAGDVLTYSATLESGNALPSWLSFNATTRTFSGTPTNDNVGSLNVKAIATDKAGATVSDIFTVAVENLNDAPIVSNAIADQNAKQGTAFNFQVPSNTFTDIDAGDVLSYSATLDNGDALPSWLTFNSTTRTFSGTPTNDNVGNLNIKAIATDKVGENVSDIFTITVENVNDAPTLANAIADQNAKQGNAFNFQIPTNTFTDIDAGDVLGYSATLENGTALPSWLTFNPTTRTFSGTPTNDNVSRSALKNQSM